jgi:hypothetical protein
VAWESRIGGYDECCKADPSLASFVFTLKNPHGFPARKFALKAEEKGRAIRCVFSCCPLFRDIFVFDDCNANARSDSNLGISYTNDTSLRGKTVLTGSCKFTVKEIEVFEVAD